MHSSRGPLGLKAADKGFREPHGGGKGGVTETIIGQNEARAGPWYVSVFRASCTDSISHPVFVFLKA